MGEGAESSGESASKSEIDIPYAQKRLLKALLATGKPVVLVLFNGRPLTLSWESENVPAILDVWFAGSEAGDAIADALLGDYHVPFPVHFPAFRHRSSYHSEDHHH